MTNYLAQVSITISFLFLAGSTTADERFIDKWKTVPTVPDGWIIIDYKKSDINGDKNFEYIFLCTDKTNDILFVAEETISKEWKFILINSTASRIHTEYLKKTMYGKNPRLEIKIFNKGLFGIGPKDSEAFTYYKFNKSSGLYESWLLDLK